MDSETTVRQALEGSIKSENSRDKAAGKVVQALMDGSHLYEYGHVTGVEVHGARVPVETIEAYGLVIRLDSSGNAVSVSSPHGFMITDGECLNHDH